MARFRLILIAILAFLLLFHHSTAPAFAQLTRLKTSYSALTANMAPIGWPKTPRFLKSMD
jgi:hypothetical protein